jgi:hypothetical protein
MMHFLVWEEENAAHSYSVSPAGVHLRAMVEGCRVVMLLRCFICHLPLILEEGGKCSSRHLLMLITLL